MAINRRAYTANRIAITFGGNDFIGAIQNANINIDFRLDAVSGIGSIKVIEWLPTMATVTVDTDIAYLFGQELEQVNDGGSQTATGDPLVPTQATDALNGVVFDIEAHVKQKDIDLAGKSSYKAKGAKSPMSILWVAHDCNMNTGSFRLAKHGMVIRNGSFNALDFSIGKPQATGDGE